MKHILLPAHQDSLNKSWFDTMFKLLKLGGELRTSAGVYIKTESGFKPQ